MSSYNRFAEVYDSLMTDIPYVEYVEWIKTYAPVHEYKNLLDIGCGTGTMAQLLASAGYNVCGIDLSEEMLAIAHERLAEQGFDVPLFAMSMAELDGFEITDSARAQIQKIREKKDKNESSNSES